MTQVIIGLVALTVVGVVMFNLNRRTRERRLEAMAAEDGLPVNPPKLRGKKKILAEMEPVKPRPTIEQLVAEEAEATGVNDIPGADDLDVSLKLRVFWRDEVVRRGCDDGHLEFRIDDGVDIESIRTEDVRLVCVRSSTATENETAAENETTAPDNDEGDS